MKTKNTNETIRATMKANNIYIWMVADELCVSEWTLCRWLRKPLANDLEQRIYTAIETIKEQRN